MCHAVILLFRHLLPCPFLFSALQESNPLPGYFAIKWWINLPLSIKVNLRFVTINTQQLQPLTAWCP